MNHKFHVLICTAKMIQDFQLLEGNFEFWRVLAGEKMLYYERILRRQKFSCHDWWCWFDRIIPTCRGEGSESVCQCQSQGVMKQGRGEQRQNKKRYMCTHILHCTTTITTIRSLTFHSLTLYHLIIFKILQILLILTCLIWMLTISQFHSFTLSLFQTFTLSLFHSFTLSHFTIWSPPRSSTFSSYSHDSYMYAHNYTISLFHSLQLVVDNLQDPPDSPHIHKSHLYAHIKVCWDLSTLGHTIPTQPKYLYLYNLCTTQDNCTKPIKVGDHLGTTSRRSTVNH